MRGSGSGPASLRRRGRPQGRLDQACSRTRVPFEPRWAPHRDAQLVEPALKDFLRVDAGESRRTLEVVNLLIWGARTERRARMTRGRGLLTVVLAGSLLLSTAAPAFADSAPPPPPPPGGGGGSSGGGSSGGGSSGGSSGTTSSTGSTGSTGSTSTTSTGSSGSTTSTTTTTTPPASHHKKPKKHKKPVHKAKPKPPVALPHGQAADHHAETASSLPTVTAISTLPTATVATPATPSSMSSAVWIVVGAAALPLVLIAAFAALRPSFRRRAAQRSRPVAR